MRAVRLWRTTLGTFIKRKDPREMRISSRMRAVPHYHSASTLGTTIDKSTTQTTQQPTIHSPIDVGLFEFFSAALFWVFGSRLRNVVIVFGGCR